MIVALERNAFINFFKSGFIKIAVERRVNFSLDKFIKLETDIQYSLLAPIIPEFEEEQEIVFIELTKKETNSLVLHFEEVLKIFNSTENADFLNAGKFNAILNIDKPYFSALVERLKLNRNYEGKKVLNDLLNRVFSVSGDNYFESFIYKSLITDKRSNFIKSLVAYNVTPGILPQGNLEFILKIGLVIFDWKGRSVNEFEKGGFYKNLITNVNAFKSRSLCADLEVFYSLLKSNHELEKAYNIIISLLTELDSNLDLYKVAYFYLGFKFQILKADNDICDELILYNLAELKTKEPDIFAQVIHLLSRSFSFNELYEGVYKLIGIPVLIKKESCAGMLASFYRKIESELSNENRKKKIEPSNCSQGKYVDEDINKAIESGLVSDQLALDNISVNVPQTQELVEDSSTLRGDIIAGKKSENNTEDITKNGLTTEKYLQGENASEEIQQTHLAVRDSENWKTVSSETKIMETKATNTNFENLEKIETKKRKSTSKGKSLDENNLQPLPKQKSMEFGKPELVKPKGKKKPK